MQVALLLDTRNWAGTERHVLDLALGLRTLDASVRATIWCPDGALGERARGANLPTQTFVPRRMPDWRLVRRLVRAAKSGRCDLIHAHNGRTQLHAVLATLFAPRLRVVSTQHFIEPAHTHAHGPRGRVGEALHHALNRRTTRVIAISEAVATTMRERGEVEAAKIRVVFNGIAAPESVRTPELVRAELEIAPDAPFVVCAARLEAEKSLETLISAWPHVVKHVPNAQLRIAGEGDERARLERQIADLNVHSSAQLLGFVADAPSLIGAADVFVLPSPAEPFGLVFLESMALAKPVVAARGGAAPEIVEDGQTGRLFPPHDAQDFADAVVNLLQNRGQSQTMGAAGLGRYQSHFTHEIMARRAFSIYQEALKGVGS